MKRLVILAPNWLGDAVMALPAIDDVRRAAPDTHITVAARVGRPRVDVARAWDRDREPRLRHGAAPAELDARRAAGVARRHCRTVGVSHRVAREPLDAGDCGAGRRAPGGVLPAARTRAG